MTSTPIRVAVLGSGNIGIDLAERLLLDTDFEVVAVVGRRSDSPGLQRFRGRVPLVISDGMPGVEPHLSELDGVFDATSAFDHLSHWEIIRNQGKWVIDLTPSRVGMPMVPSLISMTPKMNLLAPGVPANYSMVTCGGQSSAPLLYAASQGAFGIREVEVSSSIAAKSAGPATRRNIDEYIASTENLTRLITNCQRVKAILVLNPADPPIMMRTTVTVRAEEIRMEKIQDVCSSIVEEVQKSVPGYSIVVAPHAHTRDCIVITARVTGAGHYLPEYAGNLDIINAAAVETARRHVLRNLNCNGIRQL